MVKVAAIILCTIMCTMSITSPVYTKVPHSWALMSSAVWQKEAAFHFSELERLLYPPGTDNVKKRSHLIRTHPIYNFLHTYYRYSAKNLKFYSPGVDVLMELDEQDDKEQRCSSSSSSSSSDGSRRHNEEDHDLNMKYIQITDGQCSYLLPEQEKPDGPYGWITLSRNRDILRLTASRVPFYGCFGYHEWAMLYSGRIAGINAPLTPHQKDVPLRVSQAVIDEVVETLGLRCTHYDAFRFFHKTAQPLNSINPLTRATQAEHEQPGCVHASMDLFKYAYQLYPFCPASLLRDCLTVALTAREIDMRASPYDTTNVPFCGAPICVETAEGRLEYMAEQERLTLLAAPVREQLAHAYDLVLSKLASAS